MWTLVQVPSTLVVRVILLLAALYGFGQFGLDGLRVSWQGLNPRHISVAELSQWSGQPPRFVRLTGYTDGSYVRKDGVNGFIEYALFAEREAANDVKASLTSGKTLPVPELEVAEEPRLIQVVVSDNQLASVCSQAEKSCLGLGQKTVQGLLRVGPGAIPYDTQELYERGGHYKLASHAVYLMTGESPDPFWVPLLITVGLGIVIFLLVVSFVPGVRLW